MIFAKDTAEVFAVQIAFIYRIVDDTVEIIRILGRQDLDDWAVVNQFL